MDAMAFLDLGELWRTVRLKDPWEPTFPDGYAPAPIARFGMMGIEGVDPGGDTRRADQAALIAAAVSAATGAGVSTAGAHARATAAALVPKNTK